MIKADSAKLKAAEIEHCQHFKSKISDALDNQVSRIRKSSNGEKKVFQYLQEHIETLLIGKPEELANIILEVEKLLSEKEKAALKNTKSPFHKKMTKIFDYKAFSRAESKWGAYSYTEKLGIGVCPYCNRQYTTTHVSSNGRCRPELDHFFDRVSYPYLAISMYNLVPSCKTCNSSFKGSKQFDLSSNIHPLTESFDDICKFVIEFQKYPDNLPRSGTWDFSFFYGTATPTENFSLKLEYIQNDADKIKKADNNAKIFKIKELYECHKDIVLELIQKNVMYDEAKIEDLWKIYGGKLFQSKEELMQVIVGNYVTSADIGKRPLAKLMKDVSKDIGLLKD